MRLVVTGANGFVGRHVVVVARARGHDVVPVHHRWSSRAEFESRIGDGPVDWVIHLGWYASRADYLENVRMNALSIQSALQVGSSLRGRSDTPGLIVAGTCLEYAASEDRLDEQSSVIPATPYGNAKAMTHVLLEALLDGELPLAWTRPFYVIGPGQPETRIYSEVAEALVTGNPIALSDGEQVRDFIDVRDAAAALIGLAEARAVGTYNLCSGDPTSLRELFSTMAAVGNAKADLLRFGMRARRADEPPRIVGDPQRLEDKLGWRPSMPLEDMVAAVISETRARVEGARTP